MSLLKRGQQYEACTVFPEECVEDRDGNARTRPSKTGIPASARSVLLAHNHPSGDPKHSFDDIQMTTHIVRVGELLGMPLLDHLVCCPETGKWESVMELAPDVHRDE